MRTNIEIDDELMTNAMKAGPYKTKKEAVEAGLKLLARQAAYREILKWRGKLKWEGDDSIDWTAPEAQTSLAVAEPTGRYLIAKPAAQLAAKPAPATAVPSKRRAGR